MKGRDAWGKMERKEKVKGILYFFFIRAVEFVAFNVSVSTREVSIFFPALL
jgi:hypothetical protein